MSAWLVSRRHIDALVTAATTAQFYNRELEQITAEPDALGRLLWGECLKSVSARYPRDGDGEWPGPAGLTRAEIAGYTHTPLTFDPVTLLKALDCYEYQSCEHDGWRTSTAREVCQSLRRYLIATLPGYHNAPWGL